MLDPYVTQCQRDHVDVSPIIKCDKNNLSSHITAVTKVLFSLVKGDQSYIYMRSQLSGQWASEILKKTAEQDSFKILQIFDLLQHAIGRVSDVKIIHRTFSKVYFCVKFIFWLIFDCNSLFYKLKGTFNVVMSSRQIHHRIIILLTSNEICYLVI